jgi:CRISPR-associated protein Cmr6
LNTFDGTWINEVLSLAENEGNLLNLKSLATLGALNLVGYDSQDEANEKRKKCLLELLIKRSEPHFEEAESHLKKVKQEYEEIYEKTVSVDAELKYRGLFGASSSFGRTAFEIGLAFDTILNLPCLPGTSVKGAVRAACRESESDDCRMFGSPKIRSEVIFADAYPVAKKPSCKYFLYPDIINPHYKDDIMDETKVKPTPIIHLTVSPGIIFRFVIAFRKRELIRMALEAFAIACRKGLGARTAIGYGEFHLTNIGYD